MNSRHFILSSMVFLIEAGKYDLAAQYMLADACHGNNVKPGKNHGRPSKTRLTHAIKQQHESLMCQYPKNLNIEQMREIARLVYEDIFESLISEKYPEILLPEKENQDN